MQDRYSWLVEQGLLRPDHYVEQLAIETTYVDTTPTLETAAAFQALYDYFNDNLFLPTFGEKLPQVVLNQSRKKGAVAFFSAKSWVDPRTGEKVDEISMVPEWSGREPRELLSTLVHEMCHLKDDIDGTAGKNGYHSQTWGRIMKRVGLSERPMSKGRFKVTHEIDENGTFDKVFKSMPHNLMMPFKSTHTLMVMPRKETLMGKRAKYVCPICGDNVRGRTGMSVHCNTCKEDFIEVGF